MIDPIIQEVPEGDNHKIRSPKDTSWTIPGVGGSSETHNGMEQQDSGIITWELLGQDKHEDHPISSCQYEIQKEMEDPVSFVASTNPDIMYVHKVMKAPNCNQFWKEMDKELDDHISHEHLEVIHKKDIPKGTKLLHMVWAMHRKRCIDMIEVYKWKARLNVHRGQQVHRVIYWETYSLVVSWPMLRFFFILSLL